jgi:tetraacyldisaccharide 4'-kinase
VNASQIFKKKVESVMRREGKAPFLSLASALYAISLIYGAGLKLREFGYRREIMPSHQLPCRVICVGNITLGGTGKTPMTMHVAQAVKQMGFKAAVVSRGYRGGAESQGGIVSDGKSIQMGPQRAGDEPYMIACSLSGIPVIVGKDRYAAGMLAHEKFRPDVIILDDGFQHLRLKRDIDLVLLDYAQPFGNSHLLPRGTLREPISSLARSHACILTRHRTGRNDTGKASFEMIKKYAPQNPLFTSTHVPYYYKVKCGARIPVKAIYDRHLCPEPDRPLKESIFGFSGIARNTEFQNTVKNLGFNAQGFLEFSDHHHYTEQDLIDIQSRADNSGARQLITTEKDLVRLSPLNPFSMDLVAVGVKVSLGDERQEFLSFIKEQLSL